MFVPEVSTDHSFADGRAELVTMSAPSSAVSCGLPIVKSGATTATGESPT